MTDNITKEVTVNCTECRFPLNPGSGGLNMIRCPRCNTWVQLEPSCFGGCMSCHKASGGQSDCGSNTEIGAEGNNNAQNVVQTKRWANSAAGSFLSKAWKVLRNGLFL